MTIETLDDVARYMRCHLYERVGEIDQDLISKSLTVINRAETALAAIRDGLGDAR